MKPPICAAWPMPSAEYATNVLMIPLPGVVLSNKGTKSLRRTVITSPKWHTSYIISCVIWLSHSRSAIPNLRRLLSSMYLSYKETIFAHVSMATIEQIAALAPLHDVVPWIEVKALSRANFCKMSALLPKKSPRRPQEFGDGRTVSQRIFWNM